MSAPALAHADLPTGGMTRRTSIRPDIQGLRAIAILLVVAFHAGLPLSGGFVGVDVFFTISGFVIAGMLIHELNDTGRISLRGFYRRRIRRLLPAAAVMSTVTLIASALLLSPVGTEQEDAAAAGAAASLLLANVWFMFNTGGYFESDATTNPFLHTWSLSVEEQFYLFFPLTLIAFLFLFGWRIGGAARLGFGALLTLSLWWCITRTALGEQPIAFSVAGQSHESTAALAAFFSPFTRAWEFLAGALLALTWGNRPAGRRIALVTGALGIALLAWAALQIEEGPAFPGSLALIPVAATVLLILSGSSPQGPVRQLLGSRPMVAVGNLSYSWYLWHWPAIVFAQHWFGDGPVIGLLAAALSLIPAVLSYRLIEQPIRSGRVLKGGYATGALATLGVLIPISLAISLGVANAQGWQQSRIADIRRAVAEPVVPPRDGNCDVSRVISPGDQGPMGEPCTWKVPDSKGTILLLGDSHAWHWTTPVVEAGNSLGYDVQLSYAGACPIMYLPEYSTEACARLADRAIRDLRTSRYAAVVMSHSVMEVPRYAANLLSMAPSGTTGDDQAKAVAGWGQGLRATIQGANPRQRFLVVGDVANGVASPRVDRLPGCLVPAIWAEQRPGCGVAPESMGKLRADVAASERDALKELANVTYADLGGRFCTPDPHRCVMAADGLPLARDGNHLTPSAARRFTADFIDAFRVLDAPGTGN